ncbi:MAG TPA: acyl-CoA dehydrogenase family protein [Candidatus Binatia bacterium]|nr:acyl-CoA dehydrogenase family protein [Candidatus Binatia bacterium]
MDFGLTDDQRLLAEAARQFLAGESTPQAVRRIAEDPQGFSPELNRRIAEQGWPGLLIPEAYGGLGLGILDAAVILTELGRALTPAPFLSSGVLATTLFLSAATAAQRRAWLPRLASGEVTATVAWLEDSERFDPAGIKLPARKARSDQIRLSGAKLFVLDAQVADVLIVAVRSKRGVGPDGVSLLLVPRDTPNLELTPLPTIDRTRRAYEVRFDDVAVPRSHLLGGEGKAWKHLARMFDVACVAIAAESQGGAERALEMAVEYAKVREQFGRAIGSFQAVKHMAAESFADIEPSRSLLWYAAWAQQAIPKDASRAASMAKARLGDVYSRVANRAVQMHGGIGFTWEHDIHFWFKRAKVNELSFGTPTWHRERVAQLSGW